MRAEKTAHRKKALKQKNKMKAKMRAELKAKLVINRERDLTPVKKFKPSSKMLESIIESKREIAKRTLRQSYINSLTIKSNNEESSKRRQSLHNYIQHQDEIALKTVKNYKDKIIKDTIKRLLNKKAQEESQKQLKLNQLKELSLKIGELKDTLPSSDFIVQQRAEQLSTITISD